MGESLVKGIEDVVDDKSADGKAGEETQEEGCGHVVFSPSLRAMSIATRISGAVGAAKSNLSCFT